MRTLALDGVPALSKVGLGTWQFGSREWGYGSEYADQRAHEIVRRALELGITLFDTAEIYGFGRSERILGAALGDRRSEAFVATKIFPLFPIAPVVERRAAGSARRLGVSTIDLYQVHQPNPVVRDGPIMEGMRRLQDTGRVREVGVSNYPLGRWQAAEAALGRRVLSNQVSYSLMRQAPDADLIPYAAATGRVVIAYSPLAQGFLSTRYTPEHRPTTSSGGTAASSAPRRSRGRPRSSISCESWPPPATQRRRRSPSPGRSAIRTSSRSRARPASSSWSRTPRPPI